MAEELRVVGLKSGNGFHILVSPRQTLRYHDCLSARWYPTPLQLRLVDDPSHKT